MRIGVISDTHGIMEQALKIVPKMGNIDLLIHLGDYLEDSIYLKKKISIEVISVKGNCDRGAMGEDEIILPVESHKIFAVHGHQYGVKTDLTRLYYRALELDCDIALFGHTHIPININHDGVFIMNPGSLSLPRGGSKASYGIIKLDGNTILGEVITI